MAPGKDPAQLGALVDREIATLASEGAPKEEMQRTETNSLRRRAFSMVTTTIRAQVFAQYLASYRQLDAVNDWERQEHRITNGDVMRVTRKYLTPANRTVMIVMPEAKR